MSYLSHLECSICGDSFDADKVQTICNNCDAPLLSRYDFDKARVEIDRDEFRSRIPGLWRWQEMLPVRSPQNIVTLGEGDAPVLKTNHLAATLKLKNLYIKDESINPTGTFKALGLSVAVSRAKELGIQTVVIPTAGNAGGALSAYAARAGVQAYVYMPESTPRANMIESIAYNAKVEVVDGLINDAAVLAQKRV